MTIQELLDLLNSLPKESLSKPVFYEEDYYYQLISHYEIDEDGLTLSCK